MRTIDVQASSHDYSIHIGSGLRLALKSYISMDYSKILIMTDENVANIYLDDVLGQFSEKEILKVIIPAGESSKSIEIFYSTHTKAIEFGLDRSSLIIALGGGVVGDLAGFIASTYMRGIDYIQMPTTILAHDSSVGGKVAINHELGKNLIGSFYPPKLVLYDIDTLHTLPTREIRSGYAEIIKEAMLAKQSNLNEILSTTISDIPNEKLMQDLELGIKIKAAIVEEDEKERGTRKHLNLGHTLGHAIEAVLGYGKITHGEAVGIGLLFAVYVSEKYFSKKILFSQLLSWLKKNHYPLNIVNSLTPTALVDKMKTDKKNVHNKIHMVLLEAIGQPTVHSFEDNKILDYIQSFFDMVKEEMMN
ncbi:3-dehydroquinate synthase [Ornithinibacillus halophilus]|uniref:3-dehydroquinate synthase n=1 Tax=Ornithinibacillus halophilus TaxID=930117 RepID=A0A1M5CPQ8_9BACI|nr:3-dehydroquinate synthase [Ornithinibacillus halophilus]SHF56719.1 3-dehydroquinate synthase [Ornithinibacillus halophilus]